VSVWHFVVGMLFMQKLSECVVMEFVMFQVECGWNDRACSVMKVVSLFRLYVILLD
jgi:hypothetical protein